VRLGVANALPTNLTISCEAGTGAGTVLNLNSYNQTLDGLLGVVATSGDFLTVAINPTWRLFDYSGSLSDDTLDLGAMPSLGSGLSWGIDTATSGQVNLMVIPEPNVAALPGGIGVLALLRRRRS